MHALNDIIELKSGEKFRAIDLVTQISIELFGSEEHNEIIFLLNKAKACKEFTDKSKLNVSSLLFRYLFDAEIGANNYNETFSNFINYDFSFIYRKAVDFLKYKLFVLCCGISICSIKPADELKCKMLIADDKTINSIGGIFFSPKRAYNVSMLLIIKPSMDFEEFLALPTTPNLLDSPVHI